MASAIAQVATPLPRRYMTQLCKHFEHKLPVSLTDTEGSIAFPTGTCTLRADASAGTLHLQVTTPEPATLPALQDVVARHLTRFAFREPIHIPWEPASA